MRVGWPWRSSDKTEAHWDGNNTLIERRFMTEQSGPATSRQCPECGREPALGADEPLTHVEWCGAEYPIPGRDATPGEESQTDQHAASRKDA